jgi:hypothetical protein
MKETVCYLHILVDENVKGKVILCPMPKFCAWRRVRGVGEHLHEFYMPTSALNLCERSAHRQ